MLLCAAALLMPQQPAEREGNFDIRFEPSAKLQTGVQVPFRITVNNGLGKPLTNAKVTLQITMADGTHVKIFPAPAISPGVYMAKPLFPLAGEWTVYVEVRREDKLSARTIEFTVPE
jgi:YtkA-like